MIGHFFLTLVKFTKCDRRGLLIIMTYLPNIQYV